MVQSTEQQTETQEITEQTKPKSRKKSQQLPNEVWIVYRNYRTFRSDIKAYTSQDKMLEEFPSLKQETEHLCKDSDKAGNGIIAELVPLS